MTSTTLRTTGADRALIERSKKVLPGRGGMFGHMSVLDPSVSPPGFPQFYRSGSGVRVQDVDGNEYVDFMCAYGPMIAGYRNPVVDAAAAAQHALGDTLPGPSPVMVELAELLVDTIAHADWAMPARNGSDATNAAVRIARAATGKAKLLKAAKSYHGMGRQFALTAPGTAPSDHLETIEFTYNDRASFEQAVAQAGDDVAAILMTPFQHDGHADQALVDPEFARAVRATADRLGAALILDEVRTGLRLDLAGSWEPLGVRPDLSAFSKALGNGYAISAVTGTEALREAASAVTLTGSFWFSATSMAAAVATLTLLRERDAVAHMQAVGEQFRTGLDAQARAHGFTLDQTGPVQMPMVRFTDDPDLVRGFAFTSAAVAAGVILSPWHNMFMSLAHTPEDIAWALERTDAAFDAVV